MDYPRPYKEIARLISGSICEVCGKQIYGNQTRGTICQICQERLGLIFENAPSQEPQWKWQCSACNAELVVADSSWRWEGKKWAHKCPDAIPQAGHFEANFNFVGSSSDEAALLARLNIITELWRDLAVALGDERPEKVNIDALIERVRNLRTRLEVSLRAYESVQKTFAGEQLELVLQNNKLRSDLAKQEWDADGYAGLLSDMNQVKKILGIVS